MAMMKKLAILGIAGLALGATACGSSGTDTAASTTTAAPASSTTTTSEKETTTTTEKEKSSTTKVTKPAKVEKIDKSDLPADTPALPTDFELTSDEEDCIYTVILEYTEDPSNEVDDATLAGVTGGAMAACIDQDKLASGITASVAEAAPQLDETQLSCLEDEIAGAPTEDLAVFLGAFIYEGPGAEAMQEPFLTALDDACGLST
jgi:hypothetical protein